MSNDSKKILPINYTNREFEDIRDDLMQIVERFYPDTFQDWSEGSFGSLMLDTISYVGDQLNFYLDYNINEAFLDTAYQYGNIVRHGRALGYKNTGPESSFGEVAIFVLVPASATGIGPDANYFPILKRGTTFSGTNGQSYILTQNIDFSSPTLPRVVAKVNDDTGAPTYYAIKAYGTVVSGFFGQQKVTVGPYERFKKIAINNPNITEIIRVIDTEGNEYFEVDYLSQDIIFREISNKNFKNDNVPSILKPMMVSRKFVVQRDFSKTILQFGSGKAGSDDLVAAPQTVALNAYGKDYTTDISFDPSRLSQNQDLGIVPENTELTVVFRSTNTIQSNAAVAAVNTVDNALLSFVDAQKLTQTKITDIRNSIEVINETPITGVQSRVSPEEIKQRIYNTFPTQNRAVTQSDYENFCYRMPGKFGSISRVSAQRDPSSKKRNLNLYVVSEDNNEKLTLTNNTIKNNLKTWLNHYRMMNDTVDILDPYIINIGIRYHIKLVAGADKFVAATAAQDALKKRFETKFYIGEPLYVSEIYKILKDVPEVLDVIDVKVSNKQGTDYSGNILNIQKNMSPDGSHIVTPSNAILEIKYPEVDIKGKMT